MVGRVSWGEGHLHCGQGVQSPKWSLGGKGDQGRSLELVLGDMEDGSGKSDLQLTGLETG